MSMKAPEDRSSTRVFVSYARADQVRVDSLINALAEDDGFDVLIDHKEILPSEEWQPRLSNLIRSADAVVFAVSASSLNSKVCAWELDSAFEMGKRVVPLVIEESDNEVPPELAKLNYLFATKGADDAAVLRDLKQTLNLDITWLREHTRLGDLANRWHQSRKLGAQPLRGRELEAAEQWLSRTPKSAPNPTEMQRTYIYESRQMATRRQRYTFAATACLALVLAGLAAFAWTQRNAAVEGQRLAEQALRDATQAARTMTNDLAGDLQRSQVPREMVRSILEKAVGLQENLSKNFPNDQPLQITQIQSRLRIASVLERQNEIPTALELYEQALGDAEHLASLPDATIRTKSYVPLALMNIGRLHHATLDHAKAEEALKRAVTIYRQAHTPDDAHPTLRSRLAEGLTMLASVQLARGNLDGADHGLSEALTLYRGLASEGQDKLHYALELPETLLVQANLKIAQRDIEAVRAALNEALAMARQNHTEEPNNDAAASTLVRVLIDLGDFHIGQSEPALAEEILLEARSIARNDFDIDKLDVAAIRNFSLAMDRLAGLSVSRGDSPAAIDAWQEALGHMRTLAENAPSNPDYQLNIQYLLSQIGHEHRANNEDAAAISVLEEALLLNDKLSGMNVPVHYDNDLGVRESLVGALMNTDQPERAEALNQTILTRVAQLIEEQTKDVVLDRYLAVAASADANLKLRKNEFEAAEVSFRKSAELFAQLHTDAANPIAFGRDYQIVLNQWAGTMVDLERPADAVPILERALSAIMSVRERDPTNDFYKADTYITYRTLAIAHEQLGQVKEAFEASREGLRLMEDLTERNPDNIGWQHDYLRAGDFTAMVLFNNQYYENAAGMFEELNAVSRRLSNAYPEDETFRFFKNDSRQYWALSLAGISNQSLIDGDFGAAVTSGERAFELYPASLIVKSLLANAYMMNENVARARALYLSNRGMVFEDGDLWEDRIRQNFESLRANGSDHPLMQEVLREFTN